MRMMAAPTLSCTHDANAWPSDRYAGLPAPKPGERVILWVQNSHAAPIPAGAMSLDRMGAEAPVPFAREVPGFASVAVDVAELLPGLHWPAQIEFRAGRHVVRPRYEVVAGRAHAHRACECRARRSAAGSRDPGARQHARPRLPAALPDHAARPLPLDRAADADGGEPGRPADPPRRVRQRGPQARRALPRLPQRATTISRSISTNSTPRADMPSWSMISATAAARMAGCTR